MVGKADFTAIKYDQKADTQYAIHLLDLLRDKKPVSAPRHVDKALILYGAGNLGKMANEYFKAIDIPVALVVDAKPYQYTDDRYWQNTTIIKPEDVSIEMKQNCLLAVTVVTVPFNPLCMYLMGSGWTDVVPFYDIAESYVNVHPLSNGWFAGCFGAEDVSNLKLVLQTWSDDTSRAHHLQFISWHYLREEWVFGASPVTTQDRYFIPEITSILNDDEALLDVGAYHGETTIRFIRVVDNRFRAALMLEPDEKNLSALRQRLLSLPSEIAERIRAMPTAVGAEAGTGRFSGGLGYASQLSRIGSHPVAIETIDELDFQPSIIKLHLEGGELDALKGAKTTLSRCRPVIMATSYHNSLGLWELPLWLMQVLPDYRYYLRLHSWCGTGAVIYCIPKERYRL